MSGFAGCVGSLYFLCLLSRHRMVLPNRAALSLTQESFLCSRTALPLVFVFYSFFSPPLSLALPQLIRFQIQLSCSNYTLPTTCICTASAVKNVSVFPRSTLPEGALNDVPGRVNTGDSDLLFFRWLPLQIPLQSDHSRSTLGPFLCSSCSFS